MTEFAANHEAPVYASGQIDIAADPEVVWEVLTDFESWPRWNPDVRSLSIDGPVREGTSFSWKAGPGTVRSTLQVVHAPRVVGWTGTTMTISARHVWFLERAGTGTIVRTDESWDGFLARLLRKPFHRTVLDAIDSALRHLKTESERRAGPDR